MRSVRSDRRASRVGDPLVKPPPFTYHRPGSVDQTLHLLDTLGPDIKVLAGGQSLMPLLNLRLARPAHVVDINGLADELGRIELVGERLHVGPLVRQERLRTDPLLTAHAPLVGEAVRWIGHRAIRARGTLGGSLAHADPAAELPVVAVALDSDIVVRGVRGERTARAEDFFEGHFSTALGDDELLVEWCLPALGERRWGFAELARRRGDFALVLVAVVLALDGDGVVTSCRIAAGAISSIPALLDEAGFVLIGRRPDRAAVADTARAAAAGCRPSSDVHASADYRKAMVEVLVRRALAQALTRPSAAAPASVPEASSAPKASGSPTSAPTPHARADQAPSLPVDGGVHAGLQRRSAELLDVKGPVIVSLRVNGQPAAMAVPARRTLADALRDELGLTGTHLGCEHGVCGACTVLLDVVRSDRVSCWPFKPKATRSPRSREWPRPVVGCIRSRKHFGAITACSAGSARLRWCWPPSISWRAIRIRLRARCGRSCRATSAVAPAT